MAGTRRKPSQYNFLKQLFDEMLLPTSGALRRSSPRSGRVKHIDIHHMTIPDSNDGAANRACVATWRTRQASAHYGVDNFYVAQFVYDNRMAWGNANGTANQEGIIVEHANSTIGDRAGWKISETTLKTSAKLVAGLHITHKLGRPTSKGFGAGGTIRTHQSFYPTACPGPYFKKNWSRYVKMVQAEYDKMTKKPAPKPTKPPVTVPGKVTAVTVAKGDTLSSIGRKYKIEWQTLAKWNNLKAPYTLKIGQKIRLTAPAAAPTPVPANVAHNIATLNVSDKLGNTAARAKQIVDSIYANEIIPDVICLQEGGGRRGAGKRSAWMEILKAEFNKREVWWVSCPTTDFNENYVLLRDKTVSKAKTHADHIIRESGTGGRHVTKVSYVLDKQPNVRVLAASTHFDDKASDAGVSKQAVNATKHIRSLVGKKIDGVTIGDTFLAGDFNIESFPAALRALKFNSVGARTARLINWTMRTFGGKTYKWLKGQHIDYIGVHDSETVTYSEVVRMKGADHHMVLSGIIFK